MGVKKAQQSLPGWALPLMCGGGILLLVALGWIFYTLGSGRPPGEANLRPDVFAQEPGAQKR